MNRNDIVAFCKDYDFDCFTEILLADGFEEAFIGLGGQFHDEPVAVYDREKCIKILATEFQRDAILMHDYKEETNFYEQAMEYFDYNVQGSYVGKRTPIFVTTPNPLWNSTFPLN